MDCFLPFLLKTSQDSTIAQQLFTQHLHCARTVRDLEMMKAQEGPAWSTCKSCTWLMGDASIQGLGHLWLFECLGICLPESQGRTALVPVYTQVIVTLMGKYLHHNENDLATSEKNHCCGIA